MINTRIIIDGIEVDVQLFENMYDYVTEFGSDISNYNPVYKDDEKTFIVEDVDIIEDPDFIAKGSMEIDGVEYVRVNWGEEGISFIAQDGLFQTLYTIWQESEPREYHNYKSMFFETEDEAQEKADELNAEEEN